METKGTHYNCECPHCGKNNHYIADRADVTTNVHESSMFRKRCHYCQKLITYSVSWEMAVTAFEPDKCPVPADRLRIVE